MFNPVNIITIFYLQIFNIKYWRILVSNIFEITLYSKLIPIQFISKFVKFWQILESSGNTFKRMSGLNKRICLGNYIILLLVSYYVFSKFHFLFLQISKYSIINKCYRGLCLLFLSFINFTFGAYIIYNPPLAYVKLIPLHSNVSPNNKTDFQKAVTNPLNFFG